MFCWSVSGSFWPTFLITTMYNNFFRLKSSTLWKHFSDSPISVRNFILFWLVFTFLTHQSENEVGGNTHVIVLIQQQFQCSSFRVNERALQTEGPSQRTNDDDPGTFLLMRNIPCIMMATPSVVLSEFHWRCVTSLSVLSSRSKNPLDFPAVSVFFCVFC